MYAIFVQFRPKVSGPFVVGVMHASGETLTFLFGKECEYGDRDIWTIVYPLKNQVMEFA